MSISKSRKRKKVDKIDRVENRLKPFNHEKKCSRNRVWQNKYSKSLSRLIEHAVRSNDKYRFKVELHENRCNELLERRRKKKE